MIAVIINTVAWYSDLLVVVVSVAQSYPTLCDPDSWQPHRLYSSPGSSVHGSLQARKLEWVALPFFRGSSQPRDQTLRTSQISSHFIRRHDTLTVLCWVISFFSLLRYNLKTVKCTGFKYTVQWLLKNRDKQHHHPRKFLFQLIPLPWPPEANYCANFYHNRSLLPLLE